MDRVGSSFQFINRNFNKKLKYAVWYFVNFFWDCWDYILNLYHSIKKQGLYLAITHNRRMKRQLNSFIKHCQQLAPRPVLLANAQKDIDVSIIIPVLNQWQRTRACLNSILETAQGDINYELILADDCSTDETKNAGIEYPGLIVVKTDKHVGFLQNCNHATLKARGRYILLLNNKTVVLPNWLVNLYQTIEADEHIALVGSKILDPKGIIQEAGSILFNDGTLLNIGNHHKRDVPLLNIQRDTDYVSFGSILIRKSFWDRAGGFDQRYKSPDYADADLAMTAHNLGMRVLYQPNSEIIQHTFKTYSHQHEDLVLMNRRLFVEKWGWVLQKQFKVGTPWHIAMAGAERDCSKEARNRQITKRFNILYYSPYPTYPVNHGNRVRMCNLIHKFEEMGHTVHFVLLESSGADERTLKGMREQFSTVDILPCKKSLFSAGAVPFDGWYKNGMGEHIRILCKLYDIDLVLCSYVYQSKLLEFVPDHILKVIDTHDKMGNSAEMLRLNHLPTNQFSCTPEDEGAYLRRADLVIGITENESKYFEQVSGQHHALTISHIERPKFLRKKFSTLNNIGIVASDNPFNLSMVQKCLENVIRQLPNQDEAPFVIHIAGGIKNAIEAKTAHARTRIFNKSWVNLHGFVPNISKFYSNMDLIISPMMCGTGINIKSVEAMAYGMPLLTTIHGGRGMHLDDPMHNHLDIEALVKSLFTISENFNELNRLAELSYTKYMEFYERNEYNLKLLFGHSKLSLQPESE